MSESGAGVQAVQVTKGPAARRHDDLVATQNAQELRIRGRESDSWGAIAGRFRSDPRRELDQFLNKLASYLRPEDVLVDVGGGAGRNSLPMASRCREVINVDPSAGMGAEFRASAEEAGIANARFVEGDWLKAAGIEGDVLLAAHVTYFVARIAPFIEKLDGAARRRVIINVLTVPPPNQMADFFRLIHGEEREPVPDSDDLVAVLEEMDVIPEVIDVGPGGARRPVPETREAAVTNELQMNRVRPEDIDGVRTLFEDNFDDLFIQTPEGFARRSAADSRELLITWEPSHSGRP